MSITVRSRERLLLERLRETYEAEGYEFFIEPPRDIIPAFLGSYRPDAIALRPEGSVIVEVKSRRSGKDDPKLAGIAAAVAGHEGWQFKVYFDEQSSDDPPIAGPQRGELAAWLAELDQLVSAGHLRVALVFAWSILEATTRGLSRKRGSSFERPLSPLQIVQFLEMNSFVAREEARKLRDAARLRTMAVHGDFSVDVDRSLVDFLSTLLRRLVGEVDEATYGDAG